MGQFQDVEAMHRFVDTKGRMVAVVGLLTVVPAWMANVAAGGGFLIMIMQ